MRTEASRLFDRFNKKYWGNRLPRYRVIRRTNIARDYLGLCNNQTKTILLEKDLAGEDLRLTLLHEMCHIGSGSGYQHGPRFLRKLRRLVRLGEKKLIEEDIERYDETADARYIEELRSQGKLGPKFSWRERVWDDLGSLASESPRLRWQTVCRMLASLYHMTPAKFQRAAPWAEQEWRTISKQWREAHYIPKWMKQKAEKGKMEDLLR